MTTAHRPTFDPARGKEAIRGPAYHQRLLPAHTQLKYRKTGQGGAADSPARDLRADLLAAEAAHSAKLKGVPVPGADGENGDSSGNKAEASATGKRPLESTDNSDDHDEEDLAAKRRRILEETRDIDADDDSDEEDDEDDDDDSDSDDDSDDNDDAALQRELERIRREKAERKAREEQERAAVEQETKERDIALGNPLLNKTDFTIKRRWDDDVVFKNQARGTENKGKKEFINDLLRSDFHRKFMSKFVR